MPKSSTSGFQCHQNANPDVDKVKNAHPCTNCGDSSYIEKCRASKHDKNQLTIPRDPGFTSDVLNVKAIHKAELTSSVVPQQHKLISFPNLNLNLNLNSQVLQTRNFR